MLFLLMFDGLKAAQNDGDQSHDDQTSIGEAESFGRGLELLGLIGTIGEAIGKILLDEYLPQSLARHSH